MGLQWQWGYVGRPFSKKGENSQLVMIHGAEMK